MLWKYDETQQKRLVEEMYPTDTDPLVLTFIAKFTDVKPIRYVAYDINLTDVIGDMIEFADKSGGSVPD